MVATLEYPGVQYPGHMEVADVFKELKRQAGAYKDYVVKNDTIQIVIDASFGMALQFEVAGKEIRLPISKRGYDQIIAWLGLRKDSKLYKRLRWGYDNVQKRNKPSDRFWQTYANLINDHFRIMAGRKLIRTLKKTDDEWYIRAILSDKYRIIPNDQLFMAAADKIKKVDAEIWNARLSEDAFYMYAVAPGITAQVRTDRTFGEGKMRWAGDAGDVVNAAIMLRNSETGQGGCEVCPAIITGVNGSYFVRQSALSVRHVGSVHSMDALLSAETIKKKNQLVFDQVKDYVASTFDEDKFQAFVDRLNDATQDELGDPVEAAAAVRVVYDLSEAREKSILNWLMDTGDKSRYGLAQAVAREAHANQTLCADDAVQLEQISSNLIEKQTALSLSREYKKVAEKKANKAARSAQRATALATASIDL